jgi:hypothetical protein
MRKRSSRAGQATRHHEDGVSILAPFDEDEQAKAERRFPMELLLVVVIVILLFGGGFSFYRR